MIVKAFAVLAALLAQAAGGACYCIGSPPPPTAGYALVIVDPDEASEGLVEALQARGAVVLAYINVGYAEGWRGYWSDAVKAGIVHEPAGYEGEYLVEYWSPEWRSIIARLARDAVEAGYDGVYLDNVDAYMVLLEMGPPEWAAGVDVRAKMIGLVHHAAEAARGAGPGALVYANLGGAAVDLRGGLDLGVVDGVLREEVFLYLAGDCRVEPAPPREALAVLEALAHAERSGINVVVVEFVDTPLDALALAAAHAAHGFRVILQDSCDPDYTKPPVNPLNPLSLASLLNDDAPPAGPRHPAAAPPAPR